MTWINIQPPEYVCLANIFIYTEAIKSKNNNFTVDFRIKWMVTT